MNGLTWKQSDAQPLTDFIFFSYSRLFTRSAFFISLTAGLGIDFEEVFQEVFVAFISENVSCSDELESEIEALISDIGLFCEDK